TASPTPGPAIAWAAGASLLRSDDGGLSWTDTEMGRFTGIAFASREVGWLVSETAAGLVERTADGGRHWEAQFPDVEGGFPNLFAVAARDTSHAVAVGMDVPFGEFARRTPAIVSTDDGGST